MIQRLIMQLCSSIFVPCVLSWFILKIWHTRKLNSNNKHHTAICATFLNICTAQVPLRKLSLFFPFPLQKKKKRRETEKARNFQKCQNLATPQATAHTSWLWFTSPATRMTHPQSHSVPVLFISQMVPSALDLSFHEKIWERQRIPERFVFEESSWHPPTPRTREQKLYIYMYTHTQLYSRSLQTEESQL